MKLDVTKPLVIKIRSNEYPITINIQGENLRGTTYYTGYYTIDDSVNYPVMFTEHGYVLNNKTMLRQGYKRIRNISDREVLLKNVFKPKDQISTFNAFNETFLREKAELMDLYNRSLASLDIQSGIIDNLKSQIQSLSNQYQLSQLTCKNLSNKLIEVERQLHNLKNGIAFLQERKEINIDSLNTYLDLINK